MSRMPAGSAANKRQVSRLVTYASDAIAEALVVLPAVQLSNMGCGELSLAVVRHEGVEVAFMA